MNEIKLCEYGCGKIAKFVLKNGKCCCSLSSNSCDKVRERNSLGSLKRRYEKGEHPLKGRIAWNHGMQMSEDFCRKVSNGLKGKINKGCHNPLTEDGLILKKKKLSDIAKKRKIGGYKQGSGRGKHGWYKGYWCDSSWELAWVIYNLEHGIKFERNKCRFEYDWNGENHYYVPDFILEDGTYVEIKGWITEQTKVKLLACPTVLVLYEKDMMPFIEFAKEKYGKNFINQYENNPYKNKKCLCGKELGKTNKSGKCSLCGRYKKKDKVCLCGNKLSKNNISGRCEKCARIATRRVERPLEEILIKQTKELGFCKTGRIYGVSDNTIRKWLRKKQEG